MTRRFVLSREGSYVLVGDSYFLATVRTVGVRSVVRSAESLVRSAEPSGEVPNRHPGRAGRRARSAPRALMSAPGGLAGRAPSLPPCVVNGASPVQRPDDLNGLGESAQASTAHHRQRPREPGNDHPHRNPDPNHHTHKHEAPGKEKPRNRCDSGEKWWRRMGDSNPRGLAPNTLSKRAP